MFLHDVILESLLCGNTEVSCEMFSKEMNELKQKDRKTGKSGLELQFEVQHLLNKFCICTRLIS